MTHQNVRALTCSLRSTIEAARSFCYKSGDSMVQGWPFGVYEWDACKPTSWYRVQKGCNIVLVSRFRAACPTQARCSVVRTHKLVVLGAHGFTSTVTWCAFELCKKIETDAGSCIASRWRTQLDVVLRYSFDATQPEVNFILYFLTLLACVDGSLLTSTFIAQGSSKL